MKTLLLVLLINLINSLSFGQSFQSYTTIDSLGNSITKETWGESIIDSVILMANPLCFRIILKNGAKYEFLYRKIGFYDKKNGRRVNIAFKSVGNKNRIEVSYPDDQLHQGITEYIFQY